MVLTAYLTGKPVYLYYEITTPGVTIPPYTGTYGVVESTYGRIGTAGALAELHLSLSTGTPGISFTSGKIRVSGWQGQMTAMFGQTGRISRY